MEGQVKIVALRGNLLKVGAPKFLIMSVAHQSNKEIFFISLQHPINLGAECAEEKEKKTYI